MNFIIEYSIYNNNNILKYNLELPNNIKKNIINMINNNLCNNNINYIKEFIYYLMYNEFNILLNEFDITKYLDAIIFKSNEHLLIFWNINNNIYLYYLLNNNFKLCLSYKKFSEILNLILTDDININFNNLNINI